MDGRPEILHRLTLNPFHLMTARDISSVASAARKAGCTTLLELHIAGELLFRGEATLISLANSLGISLEAISFAASRMEIDKVIKVITCRESIGFSITRLSPAASEALKGVITSSIQPLRSKKMAL